MPEPTDKRESGWGSPATGDETERFLWMALLTELALALIALLVSRILGLDILVGIELVPGAISEAVRAAAWGCLAALPLLLLFAVAELLPWRPFRRIRALLASQLLPRLATATNLELLLLAGAAGVGEELLFRGLIQAGIASTVPGATGSLIGLAISAVLFGACHGITPTYALWATAISLYLGFVLIATNHILAPIACHAVYDLVVLRILLRPLRARQGGPV